MSSHSSGDFREAALHNVCTETFGQRLEWSLERRGWNYSDLARELKISRNAVSQWANDKNGPSKESVIKAAKALRVNAKWLETGEGNAELASLIGSYDPDDDARRGVSSTGKGRHKLTPGAIAESRIAPSTPSLHISSHIA